MQFTSEDDGVSGTVHGSAVRSCQLVGTFWWIADVDHLWGVVSSIGKAVLTGTTNAGGSSRPKHTKCCPPHFIQTLGGHERLGTFLSIMVPFWRLHILSCRENDRAHIAGALWEVVHNIGVIS